MSSRWIRSSSSTSPSLVHDLGAARRGEFAPHGGELVLDDGLDARPRAQDIEVIRDLGSKLVELSP